MPALTGLDMFHYAPLLKDDETGAEYSTPVRLPIAIQVDKKPKNSSAVLYGDNGPREVASTTAEYEVTINLADLDMATRVALLGESKSGAITKSKTTDVAPYVAFGYRAKKSNGSYRYYWLYKGKFEKPDESLKTQEDKVDFQTPKITGKFLARIFDDSFEGKIDQDDQDYVSSIGQNWFQAVETVDNTPLTISTVVPANNATAVSVTDHIVWTFSKTMAYSTLDYANIVVQKADGSAQVPGVLSVDAARKVVTFTPSANLAAATQYMAIVTTGVKDLAGNALAAPSVTKFTTA